MSSSNNIDSLDSSLPGQNDPRRISELAEYGIFRPYMDLAPCGLI